MKQLLHTPPFPDSSPSTLSLWTSLPSQIKCAPVDFDNTGQPPIWIVPFLPKAKERYPKDRYEYFEDLHSLD